jgi:hypothetical protein
MERRTPIFIVCSPLPQVGKSLVAQLLTEYFQADGRAATAFDVNPDDYSLAAELPDRTVTADIANTKGQVALFDQLIVADDVAKVVDLGYAHFKKFFRVMQEIGFIAEAHRRSLVPSALFIAEPSPRSSQAYLMLQERCPELPVVTVLNSGIGSGGRARNIARPNYANVTLQIPPLPSVLHSMQQWSGSPYAGNLRPAGDTARELQGWIRRVFLAFRELELRLLLETLKPDLQVRA